MLLLLIYYYYYYYYFNIIIIVNIIITFILIVIIIIFITIFIIFYVHYYYCGDALFKGSQRSKDKGSKTISYPLFSCWARHDVQVCICSDRNDEQKRLVRSVV